MVAFLPIYGEELESLYAQRNGAAGMSRKELRTMLDVLLAEEYIDSAQWAPDLSLDEQKFNVESGMSYCFYTQHNLLRSSQASEAAMKYSSAVTNLDLIMDMISQKGVCQFRMGNYDEALLAFEEMRAKAEELDNPFHLSSALNNLAAVYTAASSPKNNYAEMAEKCINQAIDVEKTLPDSPGLSIRYGVASEIAVRNDKPGVGLQMAREALALDIQANDTLKMARRYSQMGDALCALKRYDETEQAYLQANTLLNAVGELTSLSINCRQLGSFYAQQGNRTKALEYLTQGLDYSREAGYRYMTERIMTELYKFYKDYDDSEALHWLECSKALKDSLDTEASDDKLREYQVRFEASEKQALIDHQKQTIRHQRSALVILALVIGFILALIGGLYALSYARRQKTKRERAEKEAQELRSQLRVRESVLLNNVTSMIEEHISNTSLSVHALSDLLAMSQSSLSRQVKLLTGCTVQEYIQKIRMEKAAEMLCNGRESVSEIASACGYDDASYFSRVFKQSFQISPSQYRRENSGLIQSAELPDQTDVPTDPDTTSATE